MTLQDSGEWNSFQIKKTWQSFTMDCPFCLEEEVKVNVTFLVLLGGLGQKDWTQRRLGKRYVDEPRVPGICVPCEFSLLWNKSLCPPKIHKLKS